MRRLIAVPELFENDPVRSTPSQSIRAMETLLALLTATGKYRENPTIDEFTESITTVCNLLKTWGPEEVVCRQAELMTLREGVQLAEKMLTEALSNLIRVGEMHRPTAEACIAHDEARLERFERERAGT